MLRVALKNLLGHKFRVVFTALAIALGVGFMSGTFVLTDTVSASFSTIFTEANAGIDAQVRGESAFSISDLEGGDNSQRPDIDPALVETIREVPGVAEAQPVVASIGSVLDEDGGPLNTTGPSFGANWTGVPEIDVFTVEEGREPAGPTEAVIDDATAKAGDFEVGDTIKVQTIKGAVELDLVGIVRFGESGNLGGASFVMMETDAALETFGVSDKVQTITVIAEEGVTEEQVVASIESVLPDGVEAITAAQATEETQESISAFFDTFQVILTGFAAIALLAGSFLIYNTFGIIIGQRIRELALLRALGSSRSQVTRSVVIESAAIGLVASVMGLAMGVGLAVLFQTAFASTGLGSSSTAPVIAPRTIILSIFVGVLLSVLCSLIPARRAGKVPPIAALRESAVDEVSGSRTRIGIGALLVVLGALAMVIGGNGTGTGAVVLALAGTVLVFAGVVVLGPHLVPPLVKVLGAPLAAIGIGGALGRDNARRNPKRSAGTTSALMLSVTIIILIAVFFLSLGRSINAAVDEQFKGDLEVTGAGFGFPSIGPSLVDGLAEDPAVGAVTGVQRGNLELDGAVRPVYGVRFSDVEQIFDLGEVEGDLAGLGPEQIAVDRETAELGLWGIGTELPVLFPDGTESVLTVGAVYDEGGIVSQSTDGHYLVSEAVFRDRFPAFGQLVLRVDVKAADGTSVEELRTVVETAAEEFPAAKVRDVEQIKEENNRQLLFILQIFFALLMLALIIGALGVAITLALSVFERTREIGLLRAVGGTRRQIVASITVEAILLTLLGALLGLAIGVAGGVAAIRTQSSSFETFRIDVPISLVIGVLILSVVIGVAASLLPGFRAARLNVLDAVTLE